MNIQVLVATMGQRDHSLLQKMHIQSDVIVGNQCDFDSVEKFEYEGNRAVYLNFNEKGVGLNRNNALMRADRDICLFADDDMIYVEGYSKMIENAFLTIPDADVIVFNLYENTPSRYMITRIKRVRFYNCLRYGAARIAIKLKSIRENAIYFNQCFGGGTEHSHGEDSIFLMSCIKAGLKVYAVPIILAELTEERPSTWNEGFTEKYFRDQGKLYYAISHRFWKLLCFQDVIRHRKEYKCQVKKTYRMMTKE